MSSLPSPLFLTMLLVGAAIVGTAYEPIAPFVVGILVVLLFAMLIRGYEKGIHPIFTSTNGA